MQNKSTHVLILTVLLCLHLQLRAQNLVPNPSFEFYASCPVGNSGLTLAFPWALPPGSGTTPDYFNACAVPAAMCADVGVPINFAGSAPAADGVAYTGIITLYGGCPNCREYIQTTLTVPLTAGLNYQISFFIRPGSNSIYYTDHIGMFISDYAVSQPGNQPINTVTPQFECAGVVSDTSAWTQITGIYTAVGGEQYITIGNFYDNNNLQVDTLAFSLGSCALVTTGAFYMIDSVSVQLNSSVPPPVAAFIASDSAMCGENCVNFTDTSSNFPTSWEWHFPGAVPDSSGDQNPTTICYSTAGVYDVILIVINSSGSDTIIQSNFITVFPQPVAPTIIQSGDTLSVAQGYSTYQWFSGSDSIAGATDYFYVAMQSGNYNLAVTDTNGCQVGVGVLNVIATAPFNFSNGEGLFVYPNPAKGKFEVKFYADAIVPSSINIFDKIGQNIYSEKVNTVNGENRIEISSKNLSEGIYLLKIISAERTVTAKLVVDKTR